MSDLSLFWDLCFFSPFSIAINSLGEERANLSGLCVCSICACLVCRFPLPLGVWEGLRFVIVALPGLFSYLFHSTDRSKAVIPVLGLVLVCGLVYEAICFKYCLVLFWSCVFQSF